MWAPEINFANDGRLIMEERDLRNFIVRSYYFKTLSGIKQLGPVDGSFEQFRQGFKWGNASAEAWKLAPDGTQWKDPGLTEGTIALLILICFSMVYRHWRPVNKTAGSTGVSSSLYLTRSVHTHAGRQVREMA